MKEFTVVFPYGFDSQGAPALLMGQQPFGKPLAGYFNGPGGKINPDIDASIVDGAKREFKEELGISALGLVYIGEIRHEQKVVHFFVTEVPYIMYKDTDVMINYTWFPLADMSFVQHMLPGDEPIITFIRKHFTDLHKGREFTPFKIVKEGKAIAEAVKFL